MSERLDLLDDDAPDVFHSCCSGVVSLECSFGDSRSSLHREARPRRGWLAQTCRGRLAGGVRVVAKLLNFIPLRKEHMVITSFLSKAPLSEIFVHDSNADHFPQIKAHINIHLNFVPHNCANNTFLSFFDYGSKALLA